MKTGVGMLGWSVGGDGDLDREANINGMEMGIGRGVGARTGMLQGKKRKRKERKAGTTCA